MKGKIDSKGRSGTARGGVDILGTNSEIGRKLKQYYDEILSEEVPDRFSQLLEQLDTVETSSGKGK